MTNQSTIQLEIERQIFDGWERFTAVFDMESLVSTFSLDLFDRDRVISSDFQAGISCTISAIDNRRPQSYTQLISGYINATDRTVSSSANRLTVTGTDGLVDLLDCSAIRESQTWTKAAFTSIVGDLVRPFGVAVDKTSLAGVDPIIEKFTLQSSETVFDAIERLCRSQAVIPLGTMDGELKLGYAATQADRALVDLEVGVNVLEVKESVDWTDRYSEYTAIGQYPGGGKRWTKAMLQAAATAQDTGVTRYRPKLFIAENKATNEILVKRVRWEAQTRSGRATEYTVIVPGWYQRDQFGAYFGLWEKNKRVNFRWPERGIDLERLITQVTFTLDGDGERTALVLKHPDTFSAQPGERVDLT